MHIRQRRRSYKYVQYSAPFSRDGNISVADCMPLSSLLKTIKINGDVDHWCFVMCDTIWTVQYSLYIHLYSPDGSNNK